ncbi:hypothetical protein SNEBB_002398 [Seison nebaliae]|nr:hypothetical protein SNEBB_002398 [Seison nebaliae]
MERKIIEIIKSDSLDEWLTNVDNNINYCNPSRDTLLHLAVRYESLKSVKCLLSRGSSCLPTNILGNSVIHEAAKVKNIELLKNCLNYVHFDVNISNLQNITPLHYAIFNGNYEAAKLLLEKHANGIAPTDIPMNNELRKLIESFSSKISLQNQSDTLLKSFVESDDESVNLFNNLQISSKTQLISSSFVQFIKFLSHQPDGEIWYTNLGIAKRYHHNMIDAVNSNKIIENLKQLRLLNSNNIAPIYFASLSPDFLLFTHIKLTKTLHNYLYKEINGERLTNKFIRIVMERLINGLMHLRDNLSPILFNQLTLTPHSILLNKFLESKISVWSCIRNDEEKLIYPHPIYISAEEVKGEECWNKEKSLSFSLAIILMELVNGKLPLENDCSLVIGEKILSNNILYPIDQVTEPQIKEFCGKCIMSNNFNRPNFNDFLKFVQSLKNY